MPMVCLRSKIQLKLIRMFLLLCLAKKISLPLRLKNQRQLLDKNSKAQTLPDVQAIQKEAKHKRFEQLKLALTWLQETYPLCFKAEEPIPLKKRIEKDIFSELPEGLPFSKVSMREALHYYTSSPQYRNQSYDGDPSL